MSSNLQNLMDDLSKTHWVPDEDNPNEFTAYLKYNDVIDALNADK